MSRQKSKYQTHAPLLIGSYRKSSFGEETPYEKTKANYGAIEKDISLSGRETKMASNGTGPSLNLLQKHFGPSFMTKKRKEDIDLPNKSGKTDPRILSKAMKGSTMDKMKFGYQKFKELGAKK